MPGYVYEAIMCWVVGGFLCGAYSLCLCLFRRYLAILFVNRSMKLFHILLNTLSRISRWDAKCYTRSNFSTLASNTQVLSYIHPSSKAPYGWTTLNIYFPSCCRRRSRSICSSSTEPKVYTLFMGFFGEKVKSVQFEFSLSSTNNWDSDS